MANIAAKRGDLILITEIRSYSFVHGSRPGGTNKSYALGVVSSVTRDGVVKAADRIGAATGERFARWWRQDWGSFRHGALIARINGDPIDIIKTLETDEFDSIEAARDALLPYKREAA